MSVVLPASGWEMMAKVRRRLTSWAISLDAMRRISGYMIKRFNMARRKIRLPLSADSSLSQSIDLFNDEASQGFNSGTPVASKSARLRVTTVMP